MASFTLSATDTEITVRVRQTTSGYHRVFWRLSSETNADFQDVWCDGSSFTYTISGLITGESYTVNVRLPDNSLIGAKTITTDDSGGGEPDPPAPPPSPWRWWSSIGSGLTINISADEWNSFTDKINEFREYVGKSRYWFTTIRRGDYIAAWVINQALDALEMRNSVRTGDPISARLFLDMEDSVNNMR